MSWWRWLKRRMQVVFTKGSVEREMDDDLEVQLRFQGIDFENPNGLATVAAWRRQHD